MERKNKTVEKICGRYATRERSKLDELKALDKRARMPATVFAYIFGVVATLVLGTGMCLVLKAIGQTLSFARPLGIAIGCVGTVCMSANYFIYCVMRNAGKKKYGERIVSLGNELLHE